MTHLKTTKAKKGFIYKMVSDANPKEVSKIYKEVEKATDYYDKKKRKEK
jgi:hypothetical protein